ncbi:DNA cytosine methyltransferase, partial [Nocardiopsis alba]|uniref:DNA cytosine methyltransferase n=1 Tax=Nocardiopsis alba TaxID=53437 RepID=UPI00340C21F7
RRGEVGALEPLEAHPEESEVDVGLEAARIQGFPDDFRWCGGKSQIARQIGNAVPVGLAAVLAGEVYRYLAEAGAVAVPPRRAAG